MICRSCFEDITPSDDNPSLVCPKCGTQNRPVVPVGSPPPIPPSSKHKHPQMDGQVHASPAPSPPPVKLYDILQHTETKGPYTMGQLRALWSSGTLTANTLYRQEGSEEWLPITAIIPELETPTTRHMYQPASATSKSMGKKGKQMFCAACGDLVLTKPRGTHGMELFLWLFFGFPGLIYSVWRLSGSECSNCGSQNLIPVDSPNARRMMGLKP